jgi:hypothetical protein
VQLDRAEALDQPTRLRYRCERRRERSPGEDLERIAELDLHRSCRCELGQPFGEEHEALRRQAETSQQRLVEDEDDRQVGVGRQGGVAVAETLRRQPDHLGTPGDRDSGRPGGRGRVVVGRQTFVLRHCRQLALGRPVLHRAGEAQAQPSHSSGARFSTCQRLNPYGLPCRRRSSTAIPSGSPPATRRADG